MSVRRLGRHTLPDNPHWIEFPRSDGDKNQWPKNTQKIVDGDGQVNYMRPVGVDEDAAVHWRIAVGAAVAKALDMPGIRVLFSLNHHSTVCSEGPAYVLKAWPDKYAVYDHNKGKASAPRHDLYLFGTCHRTVTSQKVHRVSQAPRMFSSFVPQTNLCPMQHGFSRTPHLIAATVNANIVQRNLRRLSPNP